MSKSLSEQTSLKLGCNALYDKSRTRTYSIMTCTYSLKKVREVEFLIFLIDIVKPTKSFRNLMTQNKNLSSGFKWIGPKEFDLNKYTSNNSKGCVLKNDLEYPKDL